MLSVSTAWNNMFKKNLIEEGLIKFVIEDYGTLYKKDIFSYRFVGRNHFLCDEYPQYNATMVAVYRDDYLNFNNFIGKKVEIYYGFKINGSEEYVKALTLLIDNIEISDDGRKATFTFKSKLAYLTDTFSILFYVSQLNGTLHFYNTFEDFVYEHICNWRQSEYIKAGGRDDNVRIFPSKITLGNAFQKLAFVNCCYIKLTADDKYYINDKCVDKPVNYPINILKYPHYTKMEQPTIVVVDWLDLDSPDNYQTCSIGYDYVSVSRYDQATHTWNGSTSKNMDNSSIFVLWETCTTETSLSVSYGAIDMYNDRYELYGQATSIGNIEFKNIGGYQYNNFYGVENGKVSIFDINIGSQAQADDIQAHVADYLSTQKEVELELRINPAYELLDELYFDNTNKRVIIEELTISFNKSFSGRIKGRFNDAFVAPVATTPTISGSGNTRKAQTTITNNNEFPISISNDLFFADEYGNEFSPNLVSLFESIDPDGGTYTYSETALIHGDFYNAVSSYNSNNLDTNFYIGFKKGSEKRLTKIYDRQKIRNAPEVDDVEYGGDWQIVISNTNPFDVVLSVHCSLGTNTHSVPANSTIILNTDNASYLDGSIMAKDLGDLDQDVYCWFTDSNNKISVNAIILAQD